MGVRAVFEAKNERTAESSKWSAASARPCADGGWGHTRGHHRPAPIHHPQNQPPPPVVGLLPTTIQPPHTTRRINKSHPKSTKPDPGHTCMYMLTLAELMQPCSKCQPVLQDQKMHMTHRPSKCDCQGWPPTQKMPCAGTLVPCCAGPDQGCTQGLGGLPGTPSYASPAHHPWRRRKINHVLWIVEAHRPLMPSHGEAANPEFCSGGGEGTCLESWRVKIPFCGHFKTPTISHWAWPKLNDGVPPHCSVYHIHCAG